MSCYSDVIKCSMTMVPLRKFKHYVNFRKEVIETSKEYVKIRIYTDLNYKKLHGLFIKQYNAFLTNNKNKLLKKFY